MAVSHSQKYHHTNETDIPQLEPATSRWIIHKLLANHWYHPITLVVCGIHLQQRGVHKSDTSALLYSKTNSVQPLHLGLSDKLADIPSVRANT